MFVSGNEEKLLELENILKQKWKKMKENEEDTYNTYPFAK